MAMLIIILILIVVLGLYKPI